MNTLVYDIETGGLPWSEIEKLYVPPPALPPWSEDMVKYGNLKDEAKRKEKRTEIYNAYLAKLAAESTERDAHKCQWASEAALSPVTGRVLAIGIRKGDQNVIIGAEGETEPEMLTAFWSIFKKYHQQNGRLVGYCSNFFDMPFIVWRSYYHGVDVPQFAWDKSGRYPAYTFVDLMDRLPKRGFSDESRKLGDVCAWLGLGDKPDGVDGSMFAALWAGNAESKATALAYLENDLAMTWKLAERMGVVQ